MKINFSQLTGSTDRFVNALMEENKRLRSALSDFIVDYKETHEDCDCGGCVLCHAEAALTTPTPIAASGERGI